MAQISHGFRTFTSGKTTTSTSYVNVDSVPSSQFVAGATYAYLVMVEIEAPRVASVSAGGSFRVKRGSTVLTPDDSYDFLDGRYQSADLEIWHCLFPYVDTQPGTAEDLHLELAAWSGDTAEVKRAQFIWIRLDADLDESDTDQLGDWAHDLSDDSASPVSLTTSYTTGASASFKAGTGEKWAAIGFVQYRPDNIFTWTGNNHLSALRLDSGSEVKEAACEGEVSDSGACCWHNPFHVFSPSAGNHTVDVRYKASSTSTGKVWGSGVLLLRLDAFLEHSHASGSSHSTSGTGGWDEIISVSHNPTVTADHLVLGGAIYDYRSFFNANFRMQVEDSDIYASWGDDYQMSTADSSNYVPYIEMGMKELSASYGAYAVDLDSGDDAVEDYFAHDLIVLSMELPSTSTPATATPSAVAATSTAPASTVSGEAVPDPAAVAAIMALPAAAVAGDATATPSAVAAVCAVPAVTVEAATPATATPSAVAATTALPAASLTAGAQPQPSATAATTTLPAVTVTADATATPAAVAAVCAVASPTVTTTGTATATPAAVAAVAAVPAAILRAAANSDPPAVAAVGALPSATVTADANITATAVAATTTLPVVTVTAGTPATATPSAVAAVCAVLDYSTGSGDAYFELDGTSTYFEHPAATVSFGDVDIRWKGRLVDWTPSGVLGAFFNQGSDLRFRYPNGEDPQLIWRDADTTLDWVTSTNFPFTLTDDTTGWVRCTLDADDGAGGHLVTFYQRVNDGDSWTTINSGDDGEAETITLDNDSLVLRTCGADTGTAYLPAGRFHELIVYASLDETSKVVHLDADDYPGSGTTITDKVTGQNWTLIGSPTFVSGSGGLTVTADANVTAVSVDGTVTVPQPTVVTAGAATATPAAVAATTTLPAATLAIGSGPTPAAVAATMTAPTPTTEADAGVAATTVAAVAALPSAGISAGTGATSTPAAVAAVVAVPAATVVTEGDATATPSAVAATSTLPAGTVEADATASGTAVAAVTTIPVVSVTAGTGATATATAVAAVTTLPAAAFIIDSSPTPAAVAMTMTVAAPDSVGTLLITIYAREYAKIKRRGSDDVAVVWGYARSRNLGYRSTEGWEDVSTHFRLNGDPPGIAHAYDTIRSVWAAHAGSDTATITAAMNQALQNAGYRTATGEDLV